MLWVPHHPPTSLSGHYFSPWLQINHFVWRFPRDMATFYWKRMTLKGSVWSLYGLWMGSYACNGWNGFQKIKGEKSREAREGWRAYSPYVHVGKTGDLKGELNPSQLNFDLESGTVLSVHTTHAIQSLKQHVPLCDNCIPFCWACGLGRLNAFSKSPGWWEEVGFNPVTLTSNTCASSRSSREEEHCGKKSIKFPGRRFLLWLPQHCLKFKALWLSLIL